MEPRRDVLAPPLEHWCRHAGDTEQATAVVRLPPGADAERAAGRLAAIGMDVQSSGPGAVVGQVSPPVLRRIGEQAWVLAVEEPQRLRPLADT
jgi:hypothetical protein